MLKKIMLMTLAATFLFGSLGFAAEKGAAPAKGATQKSAKAAGAGDAQSQCQDLARRQMVSSGDKDQFMKNCMEKIDMEKKGDVNYPASKTPEERKGGTPKAKKQ